MSWTPPMPPTRLAMDKFPPDTPGLLCRCTVCGREERTGDAPLRDGWPRCHGYTMRLIDTEAFKAAFPTRLANDRR